jgi:hypothetical protein
MKKPLNEFRNLMKLDNLTMTVEQSQIYAHSIAKTIPEFNTLNPQRMMDMQILMVIFLDLMHPNNFAPVSAFKNFATHSFHYSQN